MRRFGLVLLMVLGACPASVWAEENVEEPHQRGESRVQVQAPSKYPLLSALDVTFRDVDLSEGLDLLREALGGDVEFIVQPTVEGVRIPDFTVRRLRGLDVLQLITQLIPDLDVRISARSTYEPLEDLMEWDEASSTDWGEKTGVVLVRLDENSDDTRQLRIFRLATLLENYELSIDDVATAIETVWALSPHQRPVSLRFHEETGLLIVSGSEEQIELAQRVLDRIEGRAHMEEREEELIAEIDKLELQLDEARDRIAGQKTYITKLENEIRSATLKGDR